MRLAALITIAVALSSCGPSFSDLCEQEKECEPAKDVEECIAGADRIEETAFDQGCASEFNALLECADETSKCVKGSFENSCDIQLETLGSCIGAGGEG